MFFGNSGAEANEAAFKLARLHRPDAAWSRPRARFHGRTMGALAAHRPAGQAASRSRRCPATSPTCPFGDVAALARGGRPTVTAVVLLEPIQGEDGCASRRRPATWPRARRDLTRAAGALLVLDEVQTGIGRTGALVRPPAPHGRREPDVVTLAKGLGGGLPIGALPRPSATRGRRCSAPASTAPPSAATRSLRGRASRCCDTIERDGLLDHVERGRRAAAARLEALGHPLVAGVRGARAAARPSCSTAPGRRHGRQPRCSRPGSWSTPVAAGRAPARPAADPHRRAGRRVRRGAAAALDRPGRPDGAPAPAADAWDAR